MIFFKLLYLEIFYLFYANLKLITGWSTKAWVRNSLLQNYFAFGRSDIDVSILFSKDENFMERSINIRKIIPFFLLIKEINYYCPFTIFQSSSLINQYEWNRDPLLHKWIKCPEKETTNAKLVYFLRTFFSQKKITIKLDGRNIKKWKYHFKNIGLDYPLNEKTSSELLHFVFSQLVPEQKADLVEKILKLHHAQINDLPLQSLINDKSDNFFYLTYFPHLFCYLPVVELSIDRFNARILCGQIEWELWGIISQPWLFQKNENGLQHLQNLENLLKRTHSNEENSIFEIEQLIRKIEHLKFFFKNA